MSKRDYTHVRLLYPEIKAMIEAGKTQREIAEKLGISRSYVSRIEKRAVGHMREAFYELSGKTL